MRPLAFLDIETSSLKPGKNNGVFGEILEVAIIIDTGNGATPIENIWRFKPMHIEEHCAKSTEINGYTERMHQYVNLRPYYDVLPEIHQALRHKRVIVVGHNVSFDINFLNYWFAVCNISPVSPRVIDTMALAFEHLLPCGFTSFSLSRLKSFMGYDYDSHDAISDARCCRALYYDLLRATTLKRLWWRLKHIYTKA